MNGDTSRRKIREEKINHLEISMVRRRVRFSRKRRRSRSRRKYKRRRSVSRRRYKRRRYSGRRSRGFQQVLNLNRRVLGSKKWSQEYRLEGLTSTTNQVKYAVLHCCGERADITTAIDSTLGETGNPLGGSALAATEHQKWDIQNYKSNLHIRNVGAHEMFLTVYKIKFRHRSNYDGLTCGQYVMNSIVKGIKQEMGAGATTVTSKTGENVITSDAGGGIIETYSKWLHPTMSREFRRTFKIVKEKKYKLQPGDDVYCNDRLRNRVFNPQDHAEYSASGNGADPDAYANYTIVYLVRWHGPLGRSTTDDTVVGYLDSEIAYERRCSFRIVPLLTGQHEKSLSLLHDDLSTHTLAGPEYEEMKNDE